MKGYSKPEGSGWKLVQFDEISRYIYVKRHAAVKTLRFDPTIVA